MVVAVCGWFANNLLAGRNQRDMLRLQVLDRARQEIVRELRAYQQWLNKALQALSFARELAAASLYGGEGEELKPATDELWELINHNGPAYSWVLRLEENEILFPETRALRLLLEERVLDQDKLTVRLYGELRHMSRPSQRNMSRVEFTDDVLRRAEPLREQALLIGDLIVTLQNLSLSRITGSHVPLRVPHNRRSLRIEADKIGTLVIRQTGEFDERR